MSTIRGPQILYVSSTDKGHRKKRTAFHSNLWSRSLRPHACLCELPNLRSQTRQSTWETGGGGTHTHKKKPLCISHPSPPSPPSCDPELGHRYEHYRPVTVIAVKILHSGQNTAVYYSSATRPIVRFALPSHNSSGVLRPATPDRRYQSGMRGGGGRGGQKKKKKNCPAHRNDKSCRSLFIYLAARPAHRGHKPSHSRFSVAT